jgi:hypothetical protein
LDEDLVVLAFDVVPGALLVSELLADIGLEAVEADDIEL